MRRDDQQVRFDWAIDAAVAEQMEHLPDLAKSREARATGGFEDAHRAQ